MSFNRLNIHENKCHNSIFFYSFKFIRVPDCVPLSCSSDAFWQLKKALVRTASLPVVEYLVRSKVSLFFVGAPSTNSHQHYVGSVSPAVSGCFTSSPLIIVSREIQVPTPGSFMKYKRKPA